MTADSHNKSAKRTYAGQTEAERVHERRERLLEAGLEIFGTLGFQGATVRRLCRSAGLTERYFYESFRDLNDLFNAVCERQSARFGEFVLSRLPTLPTALEARGEGVLRLYFDWMRDKRIVRLLHVESIALHASGAVERPRWAEPAQMASHLIRVDQDVQDLPEDVLLAVSLALYGLAATVVTQWTLSDNQLPEEALIQGCKISILGTIRELKSRYSGDGSSQA